jgi:hypothetical protein
VALAHEEIRVEALTAIARSVRPDRRAVGDALVGGHARIREVLVQDEGGAPGRRAATRPKSAAA